MTATDYLAEVAKKVCDEAFTCKTSYPSNTGTTFGQDYGATPSQCYTDAAAQDMPATVETEISSGKIHYDATAAASCVSGMTFGTCSAFWSNGPAWPAACDQALVGTIADGAACVVDYDCSNINSGCDPTTHKCTPTGTGSAAARSQFSTHLQAMFAR